MSKLDTASPRGLHWDAGLSVWMAVGFFTMLCLALRDVLPWLATYPPDWVAPIAQWVDAWSATGVGHHWSLSVGHRAATYQAAADLLGIPFRSV